MQNALIIELYVIGFLVAAGAFGNVLSLVVLKRDRQRRESLFLLRVLAVADLFYLVFATLRYPAKYLLPLVDLGTEGLGVDRSSPLYVSMQVGRLSIDMGLIMLVRSGGFRGECG